jgi:hypothetical protein
MEKLSVQEKINSVEQKKNPEQAVFEKFEDIEERALDRVKENPIFNNFSERFAHI